MVPRAAAPLHGTLTADATTLDITFDDFWKGACKGNDATAFATGFGILLNLTAPGTWVVAGDTLTLTGTDGPAAGQPIALTRVAA